jgi:hypothetical protein
MPTEHYVPASLDNLTDVAAYVMDKDNEDEMKDIVASQTHGAGGK